MPKFNWESIDPDTRKKMLERMSPKDAAAFAEPEPFVFTDPRVLYERALAEQKAIQPRPMVPYPDLSGNRVKFKQPTDWNVVARVFVFVLTLIIILAEISTAKNRL